MGRNKHETLGWIDQHTQAKGNNWKECMDEREISSSHGNNSIRKNGMRYMKKFK